MRLWWDPLRRQSINSAQNLIQRDHDEIEKKDAATNYLVGKLIVIDTNKNDGVLDLGQAEIVGDPAGSYKEIKNN